MNNKLICVALHPPARLATRNSHTDVLTVDIYPFTADAQTHKITILMIFFFSPPTCLLAPFCCYPIYI